MAAARLTLRTAASGLRRGALAGAEPMLPQRRRCVSCAPAGAESTALYRRLGLSFHFASGTPYRHDIPDGR